MKIDFKKRANPFLGTAKCLIYKAFSRNDFKRFSLYRPCKCDGPQ